MLHKDLKTTHWSVTLANNLHKRSKSSTNHEKHFTALLMEINLTSRPSVAASFEQEQNKFNVEGLGDKQL